MHHLSKEEYSNLLQSAIASKYKKIVKHIKHAREENIISRIKINGTGTSFVTLKRTV